MDSSPEEFIQGVGNEVLYFFVGVSCLVVVVGAWLSTQVVEPVVSSVILVERARVDNRTATGARPETSQQQHFHHPPEPPEPDSEATARERLVLAEVPAEQHLPQSSQSDEPEVAPSSSYQADINEAGEAAATSDLPQEDRVTVRLRFLNETQRDVEASLIENIGSFKRRNFNAEISENKNVRLIFNGHVLRDEESTLRSCGIFDKCVVHCLVQQQQQHQHNNRNNNTNNNQADAVQENPEDFDLSELFIPILGVALIILWYFALSYPTYFNTMSSTALLGLTSLFLLSVYGTNFHVNVAVRAR